MLDKCRLCPRYCEVNRNALEVGYCKCGKDMIIARYSLHKWEEPCLSGNKGSGTIFFSHCNMHCIYCQNYEISILDKGKIVSVEEFSDICIDLQENGASNINLVTGTMFIPLIVEGIKIARDKGLFIPIVYNSSGYESIEGLKLLDGIVDVYLPDFKYYNDDLAVKYSNVRDYYKYTSMAIEEMYKQVGKNKFDKNGMMLKGVIVRHLLLPDCINDSKKIINYLFNTYRDNVYLSIMNQYTPVRRLSIDNLDRKIFDYEYEEVINYAYDLGVRNAFVQEGGTQDLSYIPDFDIFRALD